MATTLRDASEVTVATEKTVTVGGRTFTGQSVPFTIVDNTGVHLRLEDDTLLVTRPVIVDVIRTGETDANGMPVYIVQQMMLIEVSKHHSEQEEGDSP